MSSQRLRRFSLVTALILLAGIPSFGQRYIVLPMKGRGTAPASPRETPKRANEGTKTTVTVELLTGRLGGGLDAQEWGRLLRDIGFTGRIRQERATDKLGVFETTRGPLRSIRVVGRIERDGSVRFGDRRLRKNDAARLKEWLVELQTFGQQGAPEGQPLWGLNRAQFESIHRQLSSPTEDDFAGMEFADVLRGIDPPDDVALRFSEDARTALTGNAPGEPVRSSTKGLTKGAALAILLREQGLGVRPVRTPAGDLELVVEPLAKTEDVWPVGWEFEGARQKSMPRMFDIVPVRLEDSALTDVLEVIAERSEVPILLDRHGIARAGIDVDSLRVKYPPKRTTYSLLLRNVLGPHRLIREYRVDEAGTVFAWVTVFRPRPVE